MKAFALFVALIVSPMVGAGQLQVITSVLPVLTIAELIGGDHVIVNTLWQSGQNPHFYELSPKKISALSRAELYIKTGLPFEDVVQDRMRSVNSGMLIIDMSSEDEHPSRGSQSEHHHDHHHQAGYDPHVWTSPLRMKALGREILDALIKLDPEHRDDFRKNHEAFSDRIDALDQEIRQILSQATSRSFMVYHPAWGHFATTYDLKQIAIEHEGKPPAPRQLATLIEQAKKDRIGVILVQPQIDDRLARHVADIIGARVVIIDPLSPDYFAAMLRLARELSMDTAQ